MKTSNAYNADQLVRQRCLIKVISFSQGIVLKNVMTPKMDSEGPDQTARMRAV